MNPYIRNWEAHWVSEVVSWRGPTSPTLTFKIPLGREVDVDMKFPVLCNKSSSSSSLSSKSNKPTRLSFRINEMPITFPKGLYFKLQLRPLQAPISITLFKLQLVKVKQQNKFEREAENDTESNRYG